MAEGLVKPILTGGKLKYSRLEITKAANAIKTANIINLPSRRKDNPV